MATALFLTAAPIALRPGPAPGEDARLRAKTAWRSLTTLDLSGTIPGTPTVANLALRPALARFLRRYPAGHPLHLEGPGFIQFFDLSPRPAG